MAAQKTTGILVLVAMLAATPAFGQTGTDLTQMTLEELMNIEVTSVSRRSQRLADAAAAVYVLTREDLRRSGARSIPDALRFVPGLHVGQIDSNKWSVAVRGFAGQFSNKLQVLVDGRSVYTPLFSGVFWNVVNVPLEDVERIEIVRGPGATLWGANAVNGVINIITRSASASQGVHMTVGTGTEDRGFGSFRYGGQVAGRTSYRFDLGTSQTDASGGVGTAEAVDESRATRFAFRTESALTPNQELVVHGSYATSETDDLWSVSTFQPPYQLVESQRTRYTSGFVFGTWTRRFDGGSTSVQFSDERGFVDELLIDERRHTLAAEFQHTQHIGSSQELVVGATYRSSNDETTPTALFSLTPADRSLNQWSVFAQNELVVPNGVRFTFGAKIEHNDYTGWEFQPSVRALVPVSKDQSIWAAISRAVRLPSRTESDGQAFANIVPPSAASPLPQRFVVIHVDEPARSEELVAFEGGYRLKPADSVSLDVSAYHSRYDGLVVGGLPGMPFMETQPVPHLVVPLYFGNLGRTNLSGAEVAVEWHPSPRARFGGAYSWLNDSPITGTTDASSINALTGGYPEQQAFVRGAFNLPGIVEVDVATRYVGAVPEQNVDAYTTADVRIGFRFEQFDLSVIGRNLLAGDHMEYRSNISNKVPTLVERAVAVRLTWQR